MHNVKGTSNSHSKKYITGPTLLSRALQGGQNPEGNSPNTKIIPRGHTPEMLALVLKYLGVSPRCLSKSSGMLFFVCYRVVYPSASLPSVFSGFFAQFKPTDPQNLLN
jgi:hypothetical protein